MYNQLREDFTLCSTISISSFDIIDICRSTAPNLGYISTLYDTVYIYDLIEAYAAIAGIANECMYRTTSTSCPDEILYNWIDADSIYYRLFLYYPKVVELRSNSDLFYSTAYRLARSCIYDKRIHTHNHCPQDEFYTRYNNSLYITLHRKTSICRSINQNIQCSGNDLRNIISLRSSTISHINVVDSSSIRSQISNIGSSYIRLKNLCRLLYLSFISSTIFILR